MPRNKRLRFCHKVKEDTKMIQMEKYKGVKRMTKVKDIILYYLKSHCKTFLFICFCVSKLKLRMLFRYQNIAFLRLSKLI